MEQTSRISCRAAVVDEGAAVLGVRNNDARLMEVIYGVELDGRFDVERGVNGGDAAEEYWLRRRRVIRRHAEVVRDRVRRHRNGSAGTGDLQPPIGNNG